MVNKKESWVSVVSELPNSDRDVIVLLENYPDWTKGCFLRDEGIWITPYEDGIVTAWRDAPEVPVHIKNPFTFRTAAEARYLTNISLNAIEKIPETEKFFKVRTEILNATTRGEWSVKVDRKYINDTILIRLKDAGFNIETSDRDSITINWK